MVSIDYITINGVSSSTVDLYVDTPPMPPRAEQICSYYQSFSEDQSNHEKRFDDITVTIDAYVFDGGYNPNAIYTFLQSGNILKTSKNADFFYKVKHLKAINPDYKGHGKQYLKIEFVCSPFRWKASNAKTDITLASGLVNEGNWFAQPVFYCTTYTYDEQGYEDTASITVADRTLNIDVQDYAEYNQIIVIDAERQIVYAESGMIEILSDTSGKIPLLPCGTGASAALFSHSGFKKVECVYNVRWV